MNIFNQVSSQKWTKMKKKNEKVIDRKSENLKKRFWDLFRPFYQISAFSSFFSIFQALAASEIEQVASKHEKNVVFGHFIKIRRFIMFIICKTCSFGKLTVGIVSSMKQSFQVFWGRSRSFRSLQVNLSHFRLLQVTLELKKRLKLNQGK